MGKPTPKIELVLGDSGRAFRRWTRAGLSMRLDALAHSFNLQFVHDGKGPTGTEIADAINEGERVRIKIDGRTMIDGYVDVVSLDQSFDQGPMVSVQGRSATADLIDCTGEYESGSWEDAPFSTIAADICAPFLIDAVAGDGSTDAGKLAEIKKRAAIPFRRAAIHPGDTAGQFLLRLAQERGLTLTAGPNGELVYTIAGARKIRGTLLEGHNIGDGGKRVGDFRDRFSSYRVFGQSAGDKAWHGDNARGGDSTVEDEQVDRYRPMIVVSDGTASGGDFEDRATWERNRRAARSRTATVPLLSWLDPAGDVWQPNRLIDVKWPSMSIEGELLIEAVDLAFDLESGDTGSVRVIHPGAYDPLQSPKTRRNRRLWASWK